MGTPVIDGPEQSRTHDISLQKIGGTEYGYMLVRKKGAPAWKVTFAPTAMVQGASDTEATYANTPPEIEKVAAQEDWRKGMGENRYEDARRYAQSTGCDARSVSGIVLGPVATEATTVNSPAFDATDRPPIFNGGFETWISTVVDGWQVTAGTITKESTTVQAGTYGIKGPGTVTPFGVSQVLSYNGCFATFPQITFTCYFRSSAANDDIQVRFMLNDAEVAITTKTDMAGDTWTQLSVAYTPTAWAQTDTLEVRAEHTQAAGADKYIDTAAISYSGGSYATTAVLGTPTWLQEYASALYLLTSTGVWKWNNSTTKWDRQQGSPPNGTSAGVYTNGTTDYLAICRGTTRRWWRFDGTTWAVNSYNSTDNSGDNRYASFWIGIALNGWKALAANKLASASDPFNGSWTQVTIGETGYDVTGLIDVAGIPYMAKENGLFKRDGSTTTEIANEMRSLNSTTTGENLTFWQSVVYFPAGTQTLFQYDPGANDLASGAAPSVMSRGMADYSGRIYAMAGDDQYLYAFVGGLSGKIELLAGRNESIAGTTSWVWHPIYQATATDVAHMVVSTVTSPNRLWWISTEGGASKVRYTILPDKYSDVTTATSYTFQTGGTFTTGTYHMGFVDQDKAYAYLTLFSENLTADLTVVVGYKLDNDASWTTLGTFNTSPFQTLYFPTNAVKSAKKIRLQFTLATNANTTTPKITAYALHGLVAFTRRHMFDFTVKVSDNVRQLNQTQDNTSGLVLAGNLRDLADQPWVVLKVNRETTAGVPQATTYYVRIVPLSDEWLYDEVGKEPVRVMSIQAMEVKLSA